MLGPILDLWALIHLFFFAFLASTIHARFQPGWHIHALYWFPITYGWEVAEHFLQRAYPDVWGDIIEHWANAWVMDPICNAIGVIVGVLVADWSHHRL